MKEVKYVEISVKRMALFDHEESVPVHYWPSVFATPVNEDSFLVDLENCVKTIHAPVMHIHEIVKQRNWDSDDPEDYFELERKDFYICWSPEVEEVIGKPVTEISRLQKALNISEDENMKYRSWNTGLECNLRQINNASFWTRLKFLFKQWQF